MSLGAVRWRWGWHPVPPDCRHSSENSAGSEWSSDCEWMQWAHSSVLGSCCASPGLAAYQDVLLQQGHMPLACCSSGPVQSHGSWVGSSTEKGLCTAQALSWVKKRAGIYCAQHTLKRYVETQGVKCHMQGGPGIGVWGDYLSRSGKGRAGVFLSEKIVPQSWVSRVLQSS